MKNLDATTNQDIDQNVTAAISAALSRWPDMRRYADTARVWYWSNERGKQVTVVTVTCFDKGGEERRY